MVSSYCKFSFKQGKRGLVRVWLSANDHIHRRDPLQHIQADNLPESSLQPIPLYNRAPMLRNNEAYSWMMKKGSDYTELEMLSPDSLPFP